MEFTDDDTDSNKESTELFGFAPSDCEVIGRLKKIIRTLIGRPTVTPQQIYDLAQLLHALNRLPLPTDDINMTVDIGSRHLNGESDMLELHLDESSFTLSRAFYIIENPQIGGDSESRTILEVNLGWERRDNVEATEFLLSNMELSDWMDNFESRATDFENTVEISNYGDGTTIDWEAELGDEFWSKLAEE